jgi:DNA (cytosine-5)-methyltransferase 1
MKQYKILNLYACLGGNRFKWDEVAKQAEIEIEVTAVELDEELARLYQESFSNDTVIIADAHDYLLKNFKEFDFIWSSPPCPSHSRINYSFKNRKKEGFLKYPDFKLYEEVVFLDNFFKGKYCVENVIPYYEPLIPAKKRGRHLYWTNFNLPNDLNEREAPFIKITPNSKKPKDIIKKRCEFHKIDLTNYNGKQSKEKIANNLVDYEAGKTILQTALNIQKKENVNQLDIFDL